MDDDRRDEAHGRVAALEVLLARTQHEMATPLLTAGGFARIALDLAGPDVEDDVLDALRRVADGVDRARSTLSTAGDLVADEELREVDLIETFALADAGLDVTPRPRLELPRSAVSCHGVPGTLGEIASLVLRLFATHDGDPTSYVRLEGGGDGASTAVVTLTGDGAAWSTAALAAVPTDHGTTELSDGDDEASLVARASRACVSQLGALWLDADNTAPVLTLRLLAGAAPRRGSRGDMTLTSAACPLTDVIEEQTGQALEGLVSSFRINWVWMPPWGPDKITPDGRDQLRALGFNV